MACGVPVVSSNIGGIPEVNIQGQTGYVCGLGDVESMAKGVNAIIKDRATWEQFSKNCIEFADSFDINQVVPIYEEYYQQVIESSLVDCQ